MIKREELTNPASCMSRAHDDEMTFVLLARDTAAPTVIRQWAKERIRLGKNSVADAQIQEAFACASAMESYRAPAPSEAARPPVPEGFELVPKGLVWITREEIKAYSDWHQDHGIECAPLGGPSAARPEVDMKPQAPVGEVDECGFCCESEDVGEDGRCRCGCHGADPSRHALLVCVGALRKIRLTIAVWDKEYGEALKIAQSVLAAPPSPASTTARRDTGHPKWIACAIPGCQVDIPVSSGNDICSMCKAARDRGASTTAPNGGK